MPSALISDTRSSVSVDLPPLYTRTVTGTVSFCAMRSRGAVMSIDTPAAPSNAAVARSFVIDSDDQRSRSAAVQLWSSAPSAPENPHALPLPARVTRRSYVDSGATIADGFDEILRRDDGRPRGRQRIERDARPNPEDAPT